MAVRRQNVVRLSTADFRDGPALVMEGVDYLADCGCRVTFGIRVDKQEKVVLTFPCSCHDHDAINLALFEAGQRSNPDYDTPTETLLERILA